MLRIRYRSPIWQKFTSILFVVTVVTILTGSFNSFSPVHAATMKTASKSTTARAATLTGQLLYLGGPVEHHPQARVVFWGSVWHQNDDAVSYVLNYLQNIGNTDLYHQVVSEYGDLHGSISQSFSLLGYSFDGNDPPTTSTCGPNTITDTQVRDEVLASAGTNNDDITNTTYFIMTPPGYTVYNADGCPKYSGVDGGFHSSITLSNGSLIYAAIETASQIDPQQVVRTVEHEQFEAITDPTYGIPSYAWIDLGGNEIGDKCMDDYVPKGSSYQSAMGPITIGSVTYTKLQKLYSNAAQGCVPYAAGVLDSANGNIVSGWACDMLNGPATSTVDFYADGQSGQGGRYIGSVAANLNRPDLVSAGECANTPNHGFQFDASGAGSGSHVIWAYVNDTGVVLPLLRSGYVAVTIVGDPAGWLSATGGSVINGWACDMDNGAVTSSVDIYADGQNGLGGRYLGSTTAIINRPDLVSAGECGSTPNHGFQFDASGAGSGTHTIWAYNNVSGMSKLLYGSGSVTITIAQPDPAGWVDGAVGLTVTGWACDMANSSATSTVDFYMDGPNGQGTYLGHATADGYRPDLVTAGECGSTPNHGFQFTAPVGGSSSHTIWAYNNVSGTVKLLYGSGNVTITPGGCPPTKCQ